MTVSYSLHASTTGLWTFVRLLFRWKASLYKLVYLELLIFLGLYYAVSFIYRYGLQPTQKKIFEELALFCDRNSQSIPVTFVLGFYVSMIVSRWWEQYKNMCWPDRFSLHVATLVEGDSMRCQMLRRTLVRYINLASIICLRDISTAVKKRFPKLEHVIEAGLMTCDEAKMFEEVKFTHKIPKFWVPIQWALTLTTKCRKEGFINNDSYMYNLIKEVLDYRQCLFMLESYDWISVPLVYTQVVTLSVYTYFMTLLMSRQYLEGDIRTSAGSRVDTYFPFFTAIQFMFYVGWLKVAETLMNPLGEDDDDFELNYIIERNLQLSYYQVTENYDKLPPLEQDSHWNETSPEIPHTDASLGVKDTGFEGSVADVQIKAKDAQVVCNAEAGAGKISKAGSISRLSKMLSGSNAGIAQAQTSESPGVLLRRRQQQISVSSRPISLQSESFEDAATGGKSPKTPRAGPPSRQSSNKLKNVLQAISRQVSRSSTTSTISAGGKDTKMIELTEPLTTATSSRSLVSPRGSVEEPPKVMPLKKPKRADIAETELGFTADDESRRSLLAPTPVPALLDTISENQQEGDDSEAGSSAATQRRKLSSSEETRTRQF